MKVNTGQLCKERVKIGRVLKGVIETSAAAEQNINGRLQSRSYSIVIVYASPCTIRSHPQIAHVHEGSTASSSVSSCLARGVPGRLRTAID